MDNAVVLKKKEDLPQVDVHMKWTAKKGCTSCHGSGCSGHQIIVVSGYKSKVPVKCKCLKKLPYANMDGKWVPVELVQKKGGGDGEKLLKIVNGGHRELVKVAA